MGRALVHQGVLGESAVGKSGQAQNTVAYRCPYDVRPDRDDLAADFTSGGEGQVGAHLVLATAHQHVREIGCARQDTHEDLPCTRFGNITFDELHDVDRLAELGDRPGFHAAGNRCAHAVSN